MKPFTYERPPGLREAAAAVAARPDAKFIAGGTNLLDLMKLEIEQPAHLVDISRLPLREIERDAGRRPAHRRAGAQQRSRRRHAGAPRYPLLSQALLSGASGTAPQQGVDRRQSAPAHALPLFLRSRHALQQARARLGLLRRSTASTAPRDPRRERCLHRRPPFGHGGGDDGARCAASRRSRPMARPEAFPIGELHRLPGDDAAYRDRRSRQAR